MASRRGVSAVPLSRRLVGTGRCNRCAGWQPWQTAQVGLLACWVRVGLVVGSDRCRSGFDRLWWQSLLK